jgi:hypothetical protein
MRRNHIRVLAIIATALLARMAVAQPECSTGWLPGFASTEWYGRSAPITTFDFDGPGPLTEALVVQETVGAEASYAEPRISAWDGVHWQFVGGRFSGSVQSFGIHHSQLVAGGQFTACGSTTLNGVALFDGDEWQPLGPGLTASGGAVLALASFNGDLYAGGTMAGGIKRWTGSTWSDIAGWSGARVDQLAVFNGELIVASTSDLGGYPAVRWNGSTWTPFPDLGRSHEGVPVALYAETDRLYLAGPCTLGGLSRRMLSWDGTSLTALPDWPSPERAVFGFARVDNELFAFGAPGPFGRASGIERLTGTTWNAVAPSSTSSNAVVGATVFRGLLIVAGGSDRLRYFHPATPATLQRSLPVDGWTFGPFGLTKYDGDAVITGYFRYLGSASTGPLTRWNGREFSRFPFPYGTNNIGRCFVDGDD